MLRKIRGLSLDSCPLSLGVIALLSLQDTLTTRVSTHYRPGDRRLQRVRSTLGARRACFRANARKGTGRSPAGSSRDYGDEPVPQHRRASFRIGNDYRASETTVKLRNVLTLISQLHVAFLKFQNSVVDHIRQHGAEYGTEVPGRENILFAEAQRVVRWHYQWIVAHEFYV